LIQPCTLAEQYRHVSALIAEIGRLLGGWLKAS
jgi:hypothetical protein